MTSLVGIGFAVAGALVAIIWLPDRATEPTAVPAVTEGAGASVAAAMG